MCAGVHCEPNFLGFTTLELMELENIVANTVYLKAREGKPIVPILDKHVSCMSIQSCIFSRISLCVVGCNVFLVMVQDDLNISCIYACIITN